MSEQDNFKAKSKFLSAIIERGFLHQCTDLSGLDERLLFCEQTNQPLVAYIGFDCTAPSLHIGSLIQIMMLKHLQMCGHKPIVLMGGFTTKIGDPSGKDKARPPITYEQIEFNKAGIQKVFKNFLGEFENEYDSKTQKAFMVDNNDWLSDFKLSSFLINVAPFFSINEMIKMDSVRLRLERESPLSLLEFLYPTAQAYDFNHLNSYFNCSLQIGGSDQWGNITKGTELIRKNPLFGRSKTGGYNNEHSMMAARIDDINYRADFEQTSNLNSENPSFTSFFQAFGLTTPLLTTSTGAKMGKTADGAVWLNPDMLSPYNYWQFWRNVEDADVNRFFKLFTMLPLTEIEEISKLNINEQKKLLATEVTKMLHGEQAALESADTARRVFEEGAISDNLPTFTINISEHGAEIPAFKLFHLSGLCASGSEARKLIQGGGAKINDVAVSNETQIINLNDYAAQPLKLSSGKKKHILIKSI